MNYDLEKIKKSIIYVTRMANGNNPINNHVADSNEIFSNPNFIRCMYFIKDILEDVYKNKGIIGKSNKKNIIKEPFPLEILKNFKYKEDCGITTLIRQINDLAINLDVEKIKRSDVLNWLIKNNYLEKGSIEGFNQKCTIVTKLGQSIGIYNEIKTQIEGGTYFAVLYNKDAQEFIVNNMEVTLNDRK